jgi:type VI secretion system protein ImpG
MQQYFESEMRLLQDAAQEFAESYPEQAGMLNLKALKDRDPYIERLLEGMAYLTAHVKKRINDGVPDISENILRQICPSLTKNYPSTCVVEFSPKASLQQSSIIPKDSELRSKLMGRFGTQCRFRTCYDTPIIPLKIMDVNAEEKTNGGCVLHIHMRWNTPHDKSNFDVSKLRLYLHADPGLTHTLHQALTEGAQSVTVNYSQKHQPMLRTIGNQAALVSEFLQPTDNVLPDHNTSHPGFNLLQDYFCARERFYFVGLTGLDGIDWESADDHFTIKVDSDISLPAGTRLSAQNIVVNSTLAINLFESESEPVGLTATQMEYSVKPDVTQPEEVEVYSVNHVSGYDKATGNSHLYQPLYQITPTNNESSGQFFFNEMVRDPGSGRMSTLLQINPGSHNQSHVLSCEITATNGHTPRQTMQHGDLCHGGKGFPSIAEVTNITRPSQCLTAPERKYFQWQLISLLSLKMSSVTNPESLQKLLALFDWSERSENARRIEGIAAVNTEPCTKVIRGVFRQGIEVEIHLNEKNFSSKADMYLFGKVLHEFFTMYTSINEFVQTRVVCLPGYKEFLWLPQVGQKSPL